MLEIVPMTLKEANAFVEQNHRHQWSYFREPKVTHWMPLPEPPKEG